MKYSTICAVFLIIKSCQWISDALVVGFEENANITPNQKINGSQKRKIKIIFLLQDFITFNCTTGDGYWALGTDNRDIIHVS